MSCFYLISLKNVGSILLNNMSRVSNKHYPPAQQNTDFHSFLPTVRPPTESNTIKGHLNTCLKASGGNHESLGWLEYLAMSRTWNFNYMPVFQLRNLVQLERFLCTFLKFLETPKVFVIVPMVHIQKGFRRFLGTFRLSIEHTRQDFCAAKVYSACDWLINCWSKPRAAIKSPSAPEIWAVQRILFRICESLNIRTNKHW
jgi:hypothetical protein